LIAVRAAQTVAGIAAVAGVLTFAQPSDGATGRGLDRYVSTAGDDGNDGSHALPWRTIEHAATQVRPADTVHVAPGDYPGPLKIARGGSPGGRVRFVSDRRWKARITATSPGPITVVEIGGDHVTLEGFDVTGTGEDGTAGIGVEGSHDAVVGNHVHRLAAPCLERGNGAAGIVVGGGVNEYRNRGGLVDGNLVEHIGTGPLDGTCRLAHGIYAAVPGVTIVNNIVSRVVGDGITSWHAARQLTIANNLSATNGGEGILIGSGDSGATSAGHTGSVVANNIAYRNALNGITESSDGAHPVGPGNRYLYNLAFANRGGDRSAGSGVTGMYGGAIVSGTINADPEFAPRPPSAKCRYRLRSTSPAIDAGTRTGAPRRDFAGDARPRRGRVDIGPYELGRCRG
jgi:hypothetical protein